MISVGGTVYSPADASAIEQTLLKVPGVQRVVNKLTVDLTFPVRQEVKRNGFDNLTIQDLGEGVISVSGKVSDPQARASIQQLVMKVPGIKKVLLNVELPLDPTNNSKIKFAENENIPDKAKKLNKLSPPVIDNEITKKTQPEQYEPHPGRRLMNQVNKALIENGYSNRTACASGVNEELLNGIVTICGNISNLGEINTIDKIKNIVMKVTGVKQVIMRIRWDKINSEIIERLDRNQFYDAGVWIYGGQYLGDYDVDVFNHGFNGPIKNEQDAKKIKMIVLGVPGVKKVRVSFFKGNPGNWRSVMIEYSSNKEKLIP